MKKKIIIPNSMKKDFHKFFPPLKNKSKEIIKKEKNPIGVISSIFKDN